MTTTMQKLTGQPLPPAQTVLSYAINVPTQQAHTPTPIAIAMATPIRFATRSATAAGPINRAVERIAPIVTADIDTAKARANR